LRETTGKTGKVRDVIEIYPETFEVPFEPSGVGVPFGEGFPRVGFSFFKPENSADVGSVAIDNGRYFGYGNILQVVYSDVATFDVNLSGYVNNAFEAQGFPLVGNLTGGTTGIPFMISGWAVANPANALEFLFFIPAGSTIQITGTVDSDSLVRFVDGGFYYFVKEEPASETNANGFICKWDGRTRMGQVINPASRGQNHSFFLVDSSGRPNLVLHTEDTNLDSCTFGATYGMPWSFSLNVNICYDRFDYDNGTAILYGLNVNANQTLADRLRDYALVTAGKQIMPSDGGFSNPNLVEFSQYLYF